jgi:1-deoxy-D-xylulose-5-phosphate synthase
MYSTFAQRAYDQILNDISRRKLPVTICIDRAGIVPGDGSTHQGIYDVAMFLSMPNMIICQGKNLRETEGLLKYIANINYPSVIRFPKRTEILGQDLVEINDMKWEILKKSNKNVVISYSNDILNILDLVEKNNLDLEVTNARFINPLDEEYLESIKGRKVLVYEQVCQNGGLYSQICSLNEKKNLNLTIIQMAIPQSAFVPHGDIENIKKLYRLDDESLLKELKKLCD